MNLWLPMTCEKNAGLEPRFWGQKRRKTVELGPAATHAISHIHTHTLALKILQLSSELAEIS